MLNKQQVIGFVGKDPELKVLANGSVCTISVAATEKWFDASGTKKEHTEWFRVVLWNKNAENASKYLKKGSLVFVEGSTKTRVYTDNAGIEKKITEVQGNFFKMLDRNPNGSGGNNGPADRSGGYDPTPDAPPSGVPAGSGYDDDIPF